MTVYVRRSARRRRRRPARRGGSARRADRPERGGQDDVHRRHHRVRADHRADRLRRHGGRFARRAQARRGRARTDLAVARAVRRPDHQGEPAGRRRAADVGGFFADLVRPAPAQGHVGGRLRARRARPQPTSRDRMPNEISQGQRKLVSVARALAARPQLVCMDEPAAGLDTAESQELGDRLRSIIDTGMTIFLVDHDMGLVLNVCDYIYVIEFGVKIAEGTPDEIKRDPKVIEAYLGKSAETRRSCRSRPTPRSTWRSIPKRASPTPQEVSDAAARDRGPVERLQRRAGPAQPRPARRRGRGRRAARSERRGQDDHAAHRLGAQPGPVGRRARVRQVGEGATPAPRRPRGPGPRPRGPQPVLPADRQGEPAPRRGRVARPTSTRRSATSPRWRS